MFNIEIINFYMPDDDLKNIFISRTPAVLEIIINVKTDAGFRLCVRIVAKNINRLKLCTRYVIINPVPVLKSASNTKRKEVNDNEVTIISLA